MNRSFRGCALLALTLALAVSGCGDDSAAPSSTASASAGGGEGGQGGHGGTGSATAGGGAAGGGATGGGAASTGSGGAAVCGDARCDAGEACESCPGDCGACAATCGDGACEAPETCASCAGDCGVCPPVCGDGACEPGRETCHACAADCGECPVGECSHDPCKEGDPLVAGCDPCVAALCTRDPACCMSAWGPACVDGLATACGRACGCPHVLCETGAPLDPTCSTCVEAVCDEDEGDSFCCRFDWDEGCIALAQLRCGVTCP
ncbi:hypothetical protein [Sorangium sp. So ce1335]|uniref:hypothetical protein n=1 Tax=Sorangium sp. So ce1335 TaxID=3133335 RepID=UPI003F5F5376